MKRYSYVVDRMVMDSAGYYGRFIRSQKRIAKKSTLAEAKAVARTRSQKDPKAEYVITRHDSLTHGVRFSGPKQKYGFKR